MSLAIDYSAFESNAFDFYNGDSPSIWEGVGDLLTQDPCALGKQIPASYQNLAYDSLLIPATLVSAGDVVRQKLMREIDTYRCLQEGWDGYSAAPANRHSIVDARVFISSLPPQHPLPKPMLASDGEVSLFWEHEDVYLEASFPGDGTYHYIFNAPGVRIGADDLHVTCPTIDTKFLSYLACL